MFFTFVFHANSMVLFVVFLTIFLAFLHLYFCNILANESRRAIKSVQSWILGRLLSSQKLGEWNKNYGSAATEKKVLVGKVVKYFSKIGVAEIAVTASEIEKGERILITGPTTGVMYLDANEIRYDLNPVEKVEKGWNVSIPVTDKVRPNDKVFKLVTVAPK